MDILLIVILSYLGFSTLYYLVYSTASLFPQKDLQDKKKDHFHKIAILIPAYKEDGVIVDSAIKALDQVYPPARYTIFIIADSLQQKTLDALKNVQVEVIEVSFDKSTKAKALNVAFGQIDRSYEIAVILDADNIMEVNFLQKINQAYENGFAAMQGHRIAKNHDSHLATLDAVSEEINNNIFRKGHRVLGLSSALIGSGMAFDYPLIKDEMAQINAIGGFDKELELRLLKQKLSIAYLIDAYVYDEKVSVDQAFTNQRTRWIAAQIRYGIGSFGDAIIQLITRFNLDYFDKSLQFLMPPRLILLGFTTVLALALLLIQHPYAIWMTGIWAAFLLALMLATPKKYWNKEMLKACLRLPKTFWLMLKALAGFKKAKTNFLHTPHQSAQS